MVDSERGETYSRTLFPFPDEVRPRVLAAIRALPDETDPLKGWNLRRVLLTLYYYGPHPEVLVHPQMRRLGVRDGDLSWFRPKTGTFVSLPVVRETEGWMSAWTSSLRDPATHTYSTQTYTVKEHGGETRTRTQDMCYLPLSKLVSGQMDKWGFTGYTARTFRHDRARRIFLIRGELGDVQTYIGVSPLVAVRYAKNKNAKVEAALRNEGM